MWRAGCAHTHAHTERGEHEWHSHRQDGQCDLRRLEAYTGSLIRASSCGCEEAAHTARTTFCVQAATKHTCCYYSLSRRRLLASNNSSTLLPSPTLPIPHRCAAVSNRGCCSVAPSSAGHHSRTGADAAAAAAAAGSCPGLLPHSQIAAMRAELRSSDATSACVTAFQIMQDGHSTQ